MSSPPFIDGVVVGEGGQFHKLATCFEALHSRLRKKEIIMMYTKPEIHTLGNCAQVIQLTGKPMGNFDVDDPAHPIDAAYDLDE